LERETGIEPATTKRAVPLSFAGGSGAGETSATADSEDGRWSSLPAAITRLCPYPCTSLNRGLEIFPALELCALIPRRRQRISVAVNKSSRLSNLLANRAMLNAR